MLTCSYFICLYCSCALRSARASTRDSTRMRRAVSTMAHFSFMLLAWKKPSCLSSGGLWPILRS